jgi:hypothetical protein
MKIHLLLLSFLLLLAAGATSAQEKPSKEKTDFKKVPAWIRMMEDPQVNYYEAVKAFDLYWEGKIEPEEEGELITEGRITTEQADSLRYARAAWSQAQRNEYENLKYHFKRFKDWKRTVFPFVQSDGRILSEQERLEIWQKEQPKKD